MSSLARAGLYWRTLRHLRPRQLLLQLYRRIRPATAVGRPDVPMPTLAVTKVPDFLKPDHDPQPGSSPHCFGFIGIAHDFGDTPDWSCPSLPRLWRYNLHYFEWMLDASRSQGDVERLARDWLRNCPAGTPDAWDAYPLSLRIVNWIKYALLNPTSPLVTDPDWQRSLQHQSAWLRANLEHHILANHFLKNIKALVFCGLYFEGTQARQWLDLGAQYLTRELDEQLLPDGGHFERSPMYHAIATEDLLDILALSAVRPDALPAALVTLLQTKAKAALSYLTAMTHPDGAIALFNDSANGVAVTTSRLAAFAERVPGASPPAANPVSAVVRFDDSGYYGLRNDGDYWIIDAGPVSVDYQPGHTHCDLLSYELSLNGRQVVVDTGVHDYERSERRKGARSTCGHNTVQVDGHEQSELWDVFRVGRRARPFGIHFESTSDGVVFEGAHDGYSHLAGGIVHRRFAACGKSGILRIRDELHGAGCHSMLNSIHLAPGLTAVAHGPDVQIRDESQKPVAVIEVEPGCRISLETSEHYPEFGRVELTIVVRLHSGGSLPLRQAYSISRL